MEMRRQWATFAGVVCSSLIVVALVQSADCWPNSNEYDTAPRVCIPVLGSSSQSNNNNNNNNNNNAKQTAANSKQPTGLPELTPDDREQQYVFEVPNIDLPISTPGSSVDSAMKLFSAFNSQLSGAVGEDEQETEEEEEDGASASGQLPADQHERLQSVAENHILFHKNQLLVSGLNLTMLNVHIYKGAHEPKFSLGVRIHNTTLLGRFHYRGPTLLSGSHLLGSYRMSVDNIFITVASNLTKRRRPVESSVAELSPLRLTTNDFRLNISDLGYISLDILQPQSISGSIGRLSSSQMYLLKLLQRVLQRTIKKTYHSFESHIRSTLEQEGSRFIDCELSRFTPLINEPNTNTTSANSLAATTGATWRAAADANSIDYQQDLARIIGNEILESHLDQVELADFDYQRQFLGTNARVHFYNGKLFGLNNVRLNNDTRIKLQEQHLLVNASVGWLQLRSRYNWTLALGAAGNSGTSNSTRRQSPAQQSGGFVAFTIRAIDFDAVISKNLAASKSAANNHTAHRFKVDQLLIRSLESPKVDVGGLPGMNRITRAAMNFFMARLKQRLSGAMQPMLSEQLENSLNKLEL